VQWFEKASALSLVVRDSALFNHLITVTIVVVGIVIGMDTDKGMRW
jgi:hypothetical protein